MQEGDDRSVGTLEISTRLQTAIIMLDQSYAVTQVTPPKHPERAADVFERCIWLRTFMLSWLPDRLSKGWRRVQNDSFKAARELLQAAEDGFAADRQTRDEARE